MMSDIGLKIPNKEYRQREGVSSTDLSGEEWRDIKGYEGWYQVSNKGRVKRLKSLVNTHGKIVVIDKKMILKLSRRGRNRGYEFIRLYKGGSKKTYSVHRLVAEAFIPNPSNLPMIDHINRNKSDNRVENLRWCNGIQNRRNCDFNVILELGGEQKTMVEWCEIYGIGYATVRHRLNRGWSAKEALERPIMTRREAALCRQV